MAEQSATSAIEADTGPAEFVWNGAAVFRRSPRNPRYLPLVLGLLCLQSALFLTFATRRLDTRTFIGLHLTLCVATATFGRWLAGPAQAADGTDDDTAVVVQLAAWTALAGPFGTVVAAALLVPRSAPAAHARAADAAVLTAAADAAVLTRVELLHGSLLDNRLRLAGAQAVRPLLDVVIDGAQTEKFDALSLISKRYHPSLAAVLRRALEDKDGTVRVLAATVIAQQHNAHTKRIGSLQATARADPKTPGHLGDLGQGHFEYGSSGLLEASRADAEVKLALDYLARAAALNPDDAVTADRRHAVRKFVNGDPTGETADGA
jgi:hypothetical protein